MDAAPQRFVAAIGETRAPVLALSALLTVAFEPMKETVVEALKVAGLRPEVKVMIGGGPVDERVRMYTGADAWGADALATVRLCDHWMENGRR